MQSITLHKRATQAALTLAALTAIAAAPLLAQPVHAESTQTAGRCLLTITEDRDRLYVYIENRCSPHSATDTLTTTRYMGADWPDTDDTMLYRSYPKLVDRFKITRLSLNEDATTRDEIYTRNLFRRANGTFYEINSNEVHKQFLPLV
jgi:hypothetical protein